MENTLENKAKFISLYWGQRVLMTPVDNVTMRSKVCGAIEDYVRNSYLELTPLSHITDEDVQIFANVLGLRKDTKGSPLENPMDRKNWVTEILTFNHNSFYGESSKFLECIDTARSKGYALPWLDTTVEQQIEFGWVKLKQIQP